MSSSDQNEEQHQLQPLASEPGKPGEPGNPGNPGNVPVFLGKNPARGRCKSCHQQVTSFVESEAKSEAYFWCVCIGCFIGWLGCCLIPFCMDDCKEYVHRCPNCGVVLGRY